MGEQCLANGLYADAIAPLKQAKKFWSGLVDPADIEIEEDGTKAYALLITDFALQQQVPEEKKNVEPWTKGVQIFEMGQGLFYRAMYTDSLAPLGQTKKFWSGLCENPTEVPEEAIKAGVLYHEAQYYRDRVPEENKTKEPYTKGVQIFAMGEQCIQKGLYADAVAPLAQAKKFWKGLCDIPAKEAAPAAAEASDAAVSAEAYEAAILYLQDIDLRAKVPESKKNVEPWTKGVQIFAMGEQCLANGLYADAIAPLKQAKKFWSGLVDPADIEIEEDGTKAYALLITDFALQQQVPEEKKNVEPWTKGVQIFEMGQGLFYRAMYTDSLAPLGQTKKFWSGLCENPTEVPEEAIKAGVLYHEAQYYRDRVPEENKTKEPYTKGVQIFAMGEQCLQKGLYADAIAPLAQAKKFWKGLCDIQPAAGAFPEGKSVDTNWNAKWVFEADNNVKLYDSESGALIYDFAGKQKDLKAEGNKLSFRCDETQRFYTFVRNGNNIEMDIDRDWTDEEYHITMSAE